MPVEIREVVGKRDLKAFVYLPAGIYAGVPQWVPPLWSDEFAFHDQRKNPAYRTAEVVRYLAWMDDAPAGRIMCIIQRRMNERWHLKNARFTFLETPDDMEVCAALLEAVEGWAGERGMETVTGPHGFSDQDSQGMLIEGFEHRPTIETFYNLPYLPKLVEACGYEKDFDYRVFKVGIPAEPPPVYLKVKKRLESRGFVLVEFTKKRKLLDYLDDFVRIYNDTFDEIYGFVSLTPGEGKKLISDYLPVLDPHFIKFIYKIPPGEIGRPVMPDVDEVVAFVIGIPDMTEGVQAAKGRLLPFGILRIMRAQKRTKQLDILIAGVKKAYRNRGLVAMLGVGLIRDANKLGFEYVDAHQELEFNTKIQSEMLRLGAREYKRMRVYRKELVPGGLERYRLAFEHHHGFRADDFL